MTRFMHFNITCSIESPFKEFVRSPHGKCQTQRKPRSPPTNFSFPSNAGIMIGYSDDTLVKSCRVSSRQLQTSVALLIGCKYFIHSTFRFLTDQPIGKMAMGCFRSRSSCRENLEVPWLHVKTGAGRAQLSSFLPQRCGIE